MAALCTLPNVEHFIREKIVNERKTYQDVSRELTAMNPGMRGISARSIRRFCHEHNIYATSRLSRFQLDRVVATSIKKVGPTYGRKLMTGFLASQSFRCSQIRVGESLKCVHPNYHVQRQRSTARQMNPVPYYASYFGEKLHIDQNEKLAMFGLTHVCAIDGFSGRIVGFSLMPQKNNIVVYEQLYKSVINNYGLWDQIRVDCGREWYLMLFINQMFAHLRTSTTKEPHLQSSSKLNHTIERIWVEVNSRVNYPIKQALMDLVESDLINTEDPIHKYCISWFIIQVASIGTSIFVNSWNEHPIPGHKNGIIRRGVPNVLMKQSSNAKRINPNLLPSSSQAVRIYTSSGGVLTEPYQFGIDPIAHSVEKKSIRHMSFTQKFPSFDNIFHEIVNGNSSPFKNALIFFIDITKRLSLS